MLEIEQRSSRVCASPFDYIGVVVNDDCGQSTTTNSMMVNDDDDDDDYYDCDAAVADAVDGVGDCGRR